MNSQQIRKYEAMGFDKGQMEEIRQGLEKGLDVSWPAPPASIAGISSLILATTDSVVSNVEATEVAFCNALLVTFTGSRIQQWGSIRGRWKKSVRGWRRDWMYPGILL